MTRCCRNLPAELPAYKSTVTEFFRRTRAQDVYVDYDMPGPASLAWTAHPGQDGTFWIRNTRFQSVAHFNPQTGTR